MQKKTTSAPSWPNSTARLPKTTLNSPSTTGYVTTTPFAQRCAKLSSLFSMKSNLATASTSAIQTSVSRSLRSRLSWTTGVSFRSPSPLKRSLSRLCGRPVPVRLSRATSTGSVRELLSLFPDNNTVRLQESHL